MIYFGRRESIALAAFGLVMTLCFWYVHGIAAAVRMLLFVLFLACVVLVSNAIAKRRSKK